MSFGVNIVHMAPNNAALNTCKRSRFPRTENSRGPYFVKMYFWLATRKLS